MARMRSPVAITVMRDFVITFQGANSVLNKYSDVYLIMSSAHDRKSRAINIYPSSLIVVLCPLLHALKVRIYNKKRNSRIHRIVQRWGITITNKETEGYRREKDIIDA